MSTISHEGKRTPLSAAISKDAGKTWSQPKHIETEPSSAFTNPGAFFTSQGTMFVNYWSCKDEPNGAMVSFPIHLKTEIVDSNWLLE